MSCEVQYASRRTLLLDPCLRGISRLDHRYPRTGEGRNCLTLPIGHPYVLTRILDNHETRSKDVRVFSIKDCQDAGEIVCIANRKPVSDPRTSRIADKMMGN